MAVDPGQRHLRRANPWVGVTVSRNFTPDPKGLPEGNTYKQFLSAIRTGRDPKDGHILQAMPWPVYRNMTDHDLRAIYEYLRAVPSRARPVAARRSVPLRVVAAA